MSDAAQQMVGMVLILTGVFFILLYVKLAQEHGPRVRWFLAHSFVDGDWTVPVRRLVEVREFARLALDDTQPENEGADGRNDRAAAFADRPIADLFGSDCRDMRIYGRRYTAGKLGRVSPHYLRRLYFTNDLDDYFDNSSDCGRYAEIYIAAADAGRRLNRKQHGFGRRPRQQPLPNA